MLKVPHILAGLASALLLTTIATAQQKEATQRLNPEKKAQEIGEGDSHLTDALAQWLVNGNQAEIDLGEMAQEKASSPEVKQFAQKMVKDHTAYLQKLQKFTDENEQPIARSERPFQSEDQDRPSPNIEKPAEKRVAGFRGGEHGKHATMEEIGKRAGELHLQMTKELLRKYEGRDFDMAYVGQQIAAHTQMLANLKAMEENTTGEFATVVKEGVQATGSHLKAALELSNQLQKQAGSSAQQQPIR